MTSDNDQDSPHAIETDDREAAVVERLIRECGAVLGVARARRFALDLVAGASKGGDDAIAAPETGAAPDDDQEGESSPRLDPRLEEAITNPFVFRALLGAFARQYARIGLPWVWSVRGSRLEKELHRAAAAIPVHRIFTPDEIERYREMRQDALQLEFRRKMMRRLSPRYWLKRTRTVPLERLERLYDRRGRLEEYRSALEAYLARERRALEDDAVAVVDLRETVRRRFARTEALRRDCVLREVQMLARFDLYQQQAENVADDDLARELDALRAEYQHVRRGTLWVTEFTEMVEDVLSRLDAEDETGQNESTLLLLQNDLLLTGRERMPLLYRLHGVRERAFKRLDGDMITALGYLESELQSMCAAPDFDVQAYNERIESFIESHPEPVPEERSMKLAQNVDHEGRIETWERFKAEHLEPPYNPIVAFNGLIRIVRFAPEWFQAYRVFRSELQLKRSLDPGRSKSVRETEDIREFVSDLVDRIDEDIALDVAFRLAEREAEASGEFADALSRVHAEIAEFALRTDADAAEQLRHAKVAFLDAVGKFDAGSTPVEGGIVYMDLWRKRPEGD